MQNKVIDLAVLYVGDAIKGESNLSEIYFILAYDSSFTCMLTVSSLISSGLKPFPFQKKKIYYI